MLIKVGQLHKRHPKEIKTWKTLNFTQLNRKSSRKWHLSVRVTNKSCCIIIILLLCLLLFCKFDLFSMLLCLFQSLLGEQYECLAFTEILKAFDLPYLIPLSTNLISWLSWLLWYNHPYDIELHKMSLLRRLWHDGVVYKMGQEGLVSVTGNGCNMYILFHVLICSEQNWP